MGRHDILFDGLMSWGGPIRENHMVLMGNYLALRER